MIYATVGASAQAQRIERREGRSPQEISKIAKEAGDRVRRDAIRGAYDSYSRHSYGGSRVPLDIKEYTRNLFHTINSGIVDLDTGIVDLEKRERGRIAVSEENGILRVENKDAIDTERFTRSALLDKPLTLIAARRALGKSWPSLFSAVIVDFVPRDETQFAAVFNGSIPSAEQMAELQVIRGDDASRSGPRTLRLDEALSSESDLVLIVGHNDQGKIIDTTGFRLELDQIATRCAKLLKLCVFLACNAKAFLTESRLPAAVRNLGAREALNLASKIRILAENARSAVQPRRGDDPTLPPHPSLVVAQYIDLIDKIVSEVEDPLAGIRVYMKVIFIRIAGGLAAGVLVGLILQRGECLFDRTTCSSMARYPGWPDLPER